jgi:2-polyprenyl-3-methyl-5-hydroxy-6-metoxy-1,4-benzoquinol methylase
MDALDDELAARYFLGLASAFVRGRLGRAGLDGAAAVRAGLEAGLRLHKFKRGEPLPRVRRVIGVLAGLAPASLLDVGSGRGTSLWPLLEAFPDLAVTAIDREERRATDLDAVHRGGVDRLAARRMDAASLEFADRAFDLVTALEVLEHQHDPVPVARELVRVAARAVVLTVPSHPDDNPDHHQLFDERALEALFAAAGARRVVCERVRGHLLAVVHR